MANPDIDLSGITIEGYIIRNALSKGGQGQVYIADRHAKKYAFKVFINPDVNKRQREWDKERLAFNKISQYPGCSKYLLCKYDGFVYRIKIGGVSTDLFIIITELMDGDLSGFLDKQPGKRVDGPKLVRWMGQLLEGMAYIHESGYAYRDMKLGNIMYKENTLKIGDMGLVCNTSTCSVAGTYYSPDVINYRKNNKPITLEKAKKMDIWLLGVIFWKLAYGKDRWPYDIYEIKPGRPKQPRADLQQGNVQESKYGQNVGRMSDKVIDFIINEMLRVNPEQRPPSKQLLDYYNAEMSGCKLGKTDYDRKMVQDELNNLGIKVTLLEYPLDNLCALLFEKLQEKHAEEFKTMKDMIEMESKAAFKHGQRRLTQSIEESENERLKYDELQRKIDKGKKEFVCSVFGNVLSEEDLKSIASILRIKYTTFKKTCEVVSRQLIDDAVISRGKTTDDIIHTCTVIGQSEWEGELYEEFLKLGERLAIFMNLLKTSADVNQIVNIPDLIAIVENANNPAGKRMCLTRFVEDLTSYRFSNPDIRPQLDSGNISSSYNAYVISEPDGTQSDFSLHPSELEFSLPYSPGSMFDHPSDLDFDFPDGSF